MLEVSSKSSVRERLRVQLTEHSTLPLYYHRTLDIDKGSVPAWSTEGLCLKQVSCVTSAPLFGGKEKLSSVSLSQSEKPRLSGTLTLLRLLLRLVH